MALLRQATESDLTSIEALLRASGLPTAGVAVHLPHFVVAGGVSGIVGCGGIEFHGRHALIRSITVVEHARRAGVGRLLVTRLLAQCRAHAVQSVGLLTTTAEDYFVRQGFVVSPAKRCRSRCWRPASFRVSVRDRPSRC
ncbi:GNAT family N-acetyltransferase [Burkholderia cenocepacia]|uniref:GNAT family N-acetyltransferase n=1 Tax=Burkholderia cenocepacia TaxID=95486 RepID=UPI002011B7D7|nr:GNAT family N-acetyltransferase [Burkholderia cenocepacia]